jgi:hypothetical protein
MAHFWLACDVAPGMFPHEHAISGREYDGLFFELFVPEERPGQFVQAPPGGEGRGKVLVEVLEYKGENALVYLPQYKIDGGPYVTVRRSDLTPADPPKVPQPV